MPFSSPNYTQAPNDLFDVYLSDLGYADLKVCLALIRLTFGYQRSNVRISLTKLAKLTGMTRESILLGSSALEEKGLIIKYSDGGVTEYELSISPPPELVGKTDRTGRVNRPTGRVNRLRTIKENVLNKELNTNGGQAPPDQDQPDQSKPSLEPSTEGAYRLFNLLGDELKAQKRRPPAHFPSLACKAKFEAAERQLGDIELELAIKKALEKPILSISGITSYVFAFKSDKIIRSRLSRIRDQQAPAFIDPDQAKAEARSLISQALQEKETIP